MPIDFPNLPALDQEFTVGYTTWVWDTTKWNIKKSLGPIGPTGSVGPTGPTGPSVTGPTGAASTVTGPTGPETANFDGGTATTVYGGGININAGNVSG